MLWQEIMSSLERNEIIENHSKEIQVIKNQNRNHRTEKNTKIGKK
jgi:hypothetical protein